MLLQYNVPWPNWRDIHSRRQREQKSGCVGGVIQVKEIVAQRDRRFRCQSDIKKTSNENNIGSDRKSQDQFSSVQSLSCVRLFVTPWTAAYQASLSTTNSQSLLRLLFIESVRPSNHLILSSPLLLPSVFPSIKVFSNESVLRIRWPKYWSFSFIISPSNEYSGLISFNMDWLDLLAVEGTLKSLLQHHSSKASIIWCSAFFVV